ncbi:MAG: polysaccharide biosynthesis tyrosine autokinase, partial [Calditrichota bacterium]
QELLDLERSYNEAKANLELISINLDSYHQQLADAVNKLSANVRTDDVQKITLLRNRFDNIRRQIKDLEEEENVNQTSLTDLHQEQESIRIQLIDIISNSDRSQTDFETGSGISLQQLEDVIEKALLEQSNYYNKVQFYRLRIDRFKDTHPNLSEDMLTYANLSRSKEVLKKTLDILLEKREENRIRLASEMGGTKVIDAPRIPDAPIARRTQMIIAVMLLGALACGVFISYIVEKLDNTIKDESDIINTLNLPVFGTIPSLDSEQFRRKKSKSKSSGKSRKSRHGSAKPIQTEKLLTKYSERSAIAEAYRSLKIAIQFIATDKNKKAFVISSPSASEGKSLTTVNIAISFAQGGSRVLIIDCDLRRSTQHKYFTVNRKPGITDYLLGDSEVTEIIQELEIPGINLIAGGSTATNPAELLASKKMQALLAQLRDQYDYIFIDTPPILVCTDSRIIAEYTDGMILLAKVESTNLRAFQHAVSLTGHLNLEVLGVILNHVEFRFARAYYYTYRYYKPYSYYSSYHYQKSYYHYGEKEGAKDQEETVPETEESKV